VITVPPPGRFLGATECEPDERRNREDDEDRCGPALGPREALIKWASITRQKVELQRSLPQFKAGNFFNSLK